MNKRAQTAGTASSTAASGKKKVAVISVVVVVLLLVIVFVFVGRQLVGKAIAVSGKFSVGEAGIAGTEASSVGIGANIGTGRSIAFEFELTHPSDTSISLSGTTFVPKKEWGTNAFGRVTQLDTDTIKVEYATLDYTDYLTGEVELGKIQFTGSAVETDFSLSNVKVWSLTDATQNLITSIKTPTGVTSCVANDPLCTPWYEVKKDSLCTTWLSGLTTTELNGKLSTLQINALCAGSVPTGFNADLNKDGLVNDGDIIIIQLAMQAAESGHANCGDATTGQNACSFPGVYVCENLKNSYTGGLTC